MYFLLAQDNEDGTLTIGYKPTEPGYYIINLKFADNHVPGSPFTAKVCQRLTRTVAHCSRIPKLTNKYSLYH